MGRGVLLAIAIVWISSFATDAVMQADADTSPRRVALNPVQPPAAAGSSSRSMPAFMGAAINRTSLPISSASRMASITAFVSAHVNQERLPIAVVQSPPHVLHTRPSLMGSPRKQAGQHKLEAHLTKAVSPLPSVVGGSTHILQVWVTGYDLYGITATGVPVGPGICAVDPSTIPLGTHITIAGVGSCVAADTGPAIVGAHIDVWVPDYQSAVNLTGWYTARW